jgi:hypothetical protein
MVEEMFKKAQTLPGTQKKSVISGSKTKFRQ